MSAVPDEKGLNVQTGGAGGQVQGQVTKEESGATPNLGFCGPLTKFLTNSFFSLDDLAWYLLMRFESANKSILGMGSTYKERMTSLRVMNFLGAIEELRDLLADLYVEGYNRAFFEDPDNVKRYADIVSRLVTLYDDFTAGKITNYGDLLLKLSEIRTELEDFLAEVIGVRTPTKQGSK